MKTQMKRHWIAMLSLCTLLSPAGCANSPLTRQLYQDSLTAIRLQADERISEPHSHPIHLTAEQMTSILIGLRVVARQGVFGSIVKGTAQGTPAFSIAEIHSLVPQLVLALGQAKPDELVTFYRRISDASVGLAITSGGLFAHKNQLYVIVANNRTLPSAGLNQNIVTEIDPIDSPLLPISRTDFRVTFTPSTAVVPSDERQPWPYIDEGRLVAIDLIQLARELKAGMNPQSP